MPCHWSFSKPPKVFWWYVTELMIFERDRLHGEEWLFTKVSHQYFYRHTRFFINNGFLAQPQYCLTFSWIELQIFLKCCLKSLVTIEMNEIFSRLTCWGQKLIFLFGNRDKDKHKLCHRERQRWNWSSFFF